MSAHDIVGSIGFLSIVAGVSARFGWEVAAIIGGSILLSLAIAGAIRK